MNDKNGDKFTEFFKRNSNTDLKKPTNEWTEIAGKIEAAESKISWGFMPWALGTALTAGIAIFMTISISNQNEVDDRLALFLADTENYYDDYGDEFADSDWDSY